MGPRRKRGRRKPPSLGHDPYPARPARTVELDLNRKPPLNGRSEERMMGLEPTTFCMASVGERSRPFAKRLS